MYHSNKKYAKFPKNVVQIAPCNKADKYFHVRKIPIHLNELIQIYLT